MARLLTLDGISAAYGQSQVLDAVELEVEAGEAVTLLGRNGVGKTTLLRTIVGLHKRSAGTQNFDGEDVTNLSAFERSRRGIGYVPQGRGIFPHLTVEENLALGLVALTGRKPAPKAEIPSYIHELFPALDRLRGRKGGVLSGGEQQQLALARALVSQPKLLLLDEPTEGIQPSIVQEIEAALNRVRKEFKIAILLVEQYLQFAWSLADRYYVMQRGRIIKNGSTRTETTDAVVPLLSV